MNVNEWAPQTGQQEGLFEAIQNLTPLSGTFVFTKYKKYQLSQDGSVFWVKIGGQIQIKGALHVATDREQEMDDTISANSVILDSESLITQFNEISPTTMWVGDIGLPDGSTAKIAFQRRGPFFENAGIYHYMGFAVFAPFGPQLVNSTKDLPTGPIVSNSLPLWMNFSTASLPIYPSFLVPENVAPPYIAVHIDPDRTDQLQPVPWTQYSTANPDPTGGYDLSTYQLMKDNVCMIAYGLTNQAAWQFVWKLINGSDDDTYGFMTMPIIRDDKRTQPEIMAIAMKKRIEFDASYYMSTSDAVARRLITSASETFYLSDQIVA